ncbi:MAG: sulfotransferase [Halieaceae bacterium]
MTAHSKPDPARKLAALSNPGIHVINAPGLEPQAAPGHCSVVLGTARGGTSAIAGALSLLGVDMGPGALPPVFEDLELALAIEAEDGPAVEEVIAQRASPGRPWGFKRPGYIKYADKYHAQLGAVRYIAVFRDPMAVAARASLSSNSDLVDTIRTALAETEAIHDFLSETDAPALLVSYEKLLQEPQHFIDSLVAFSGLTPGKDMIAAARELISASPADYVDLTRSNKSRGRIDIIEPRRIRGWAQYLSHRREATVSILVNEQEVARVVADQYRADLTSYGVSEDGRCAFDAELSLPLQKGDIVRARVTEDLSDIMNSPCVYSGQDEPEPGSGIAGLVARAWQRRPWKKV